jgi:primosomal protein N' (replication factor Y)
VADVIVPRHLNRAFTYAIPSFLQNRLKIGSRVLVPFGHSTLQGVVIALLAKPTERSRQSGPKFTLRPIAAVLDETTETDLQPDLLELTRLVSERYVSPWGQALRLILPPAPPSKKKVIRRAKQRAPVQDDAIPPIVPTGSSQAPALREISSAWSERFKSALDQARFASFLLQAPTTHRRAFLLHAIQETLAHHRTALIITPEIARAEAIAALARSRWGAQVQELHSGLNPVARVEAWNRIRAGDALVVIGTRSAVFAPLKAPGLLWVEDEEDQNLKEETEPRYHAREVARMRADRQKAVLLLGSAHPSLETLHGMSGDEILSLAEEPHAAPGGAPPSVEIVDLRRVPWGTLLSEPMIEGIRAALDAQAQAILFLNRKGFAPLLLCRDCGAAPTCRRCSVSLSFYKRAGRLACHYCGASEPLPETCPACLSARLDPVGFGTERIEEESRRLFPNARVVRLDRDLARTSTQADTMRTRAADGDWEILIGTQMLFQGAPLPPVGFVGIPHADAGLHRPDFRAGERTYHSLLDAVSLARSKEEGGRIVLQTYLPAHHAITAVGTSNPSLFVEQELAFRQTLAYPPFTHLISLRVSGTNPAPVKEAAGRWAKLLRSPRGQRTPASGEIVILGPIPASVTKLRGRHRWQLLVKSADGDAARQAVRRTLESLEESGRKQGLKFEVDVDPLEMT